MLAAIGHAEPIPMNARRFPTVAKRRCDACGAFLASDNQDPHSLCSPCRRSRSGMPEWFSELLDTE